MTHELRWGILATGGIAKSVTRDLILNGIKVVAAGSRSLKNAQAFQDEFDIERVYGSYAELVADPNVDAVYVATPHPFHAENAILALQAGKHVMVEKAFTMTAAEAGQVAMLSQQLGLVVREAMWTRYLPHMVRLREVLDEGTLGEIKVLQANHLQALPTDPKHRINAPELGGGALLDLGIYPISFAWDVLGAPETQVSLARYGPTGVDSQIATVYGYPGGAIATTTSSSVARGSIVASIVGSAARLEIDPTWYQMSSWTITDTSGKEIETFNRQEIQGYGRHFQFLAFQETVDAQRATANPSPQRQHPGDALPLSESVAIMASLDAIRASVGLRYAADD